MRNISVYVNNLLFQSSTQQRIQIALPEAQYYIEYSIGQCLNSHDSQL